jgi:GTP-binding protein
LRGQLFIAPGAEVYEGMVFGENARAEDLDVNATKEKKLRTCAPRPRTSWCA